MNVGDNYAGEAGIVRFVVSVIVRQDATPHAWGGELSFRSSNPPRLIVDTTTGDFPSPVVRSYEDRKMRPSNDNTRSGQESTASA